MNVTTELNATDLDDRISAAFKDGADSDHVADLITEVEAALVASDTCAKRARLLALDPTVDSSKLADARRQMDDAAFRHERLQAAVTRLRDRRDDLLAREEDQRRQHEYDKTKVERDELAAQLKEIYPAIVEKLPPLLARIAANDRMVEYINARALPRGAPRLIFVELVARGLDGFVQNRTQIPRITEELRLPAFGHEPQAAYVWPNRW